MFETIDAISLAGSPERPNEDACGAAGRFAWAIDGAMLGTQPPLFDAPSDAAWLAGFASARLAALAPHAQDGARLLRHVIEDARAAFLERVARTGRAEREDPMTWPSAALVLAEAQPGRLAAYLLGDAIAYVRDADGVVYTLGEAPALRREESALAARLMRETGTDCDAVRATQAFRDEMAARRRALLETAPASFGLHPDAALLAERSGVALSGEAFVLLATDGLSAAVELYGALDADALLETALSRGLAEAARILRAAEEDDPHGRRHPRFKRSDDATGILLRGTF